MSLKIEKAYDKSFFSQVGTEYVCTGFMSDPLLPSKIGGITSAGWDHVHVFQVDAYGNGWTTLEPFSLFGDTGPIDKGKYKDVYTLSWIPWASGYILNQLEAGTETKKTEILNAINHKHQIIEWVVQKAKSPCYPDCSTEVSDFSKITTGLGPHSHELQLHKTTTGAVSMATGGGASTPTTGGGGAMGGDY